VGAAEIFIMQIKMYLHIIRIQTNFSMDCDAASRFLQVITIIVAWRRSALYSHCCPGQYAH
jgi:hypothetical protein